MRHHADPVQQVRHPAYIQDKGGVLYPRGQQGWGDARRTLTIFMAPPDTDWDAIATLTGDSAWSGASMLATSMIEHLPPPGMAAGGKDRTIPTGMVGTDGYARSARCH